MASPHPATNFSFLEEREPLFVELTAAAERTFYSDLNTTLIKLKQLDEAMAQKTTLIAATAS